MESEQSNQNHKRNNSFKDDAMDRLKRYYPNVDEDVTPLPRTWSPNDKGNSIGLSQNNLRVHYKGMGKSHSDAASVRTANPIPASCGIYYFEVKIISKGRDGYMGIGLTSQNFKMNRLPGWDKQSYGYHGDDGNSFCSSGSGQAYGPTFTTGDIVGCGVNMVDSTCFYTKNGHHLGTAFRDLPAKLYPTVGLQTPGEMVDTNFGQNKFEFKHFEDMLEELRIITKDKIYNFPLPVELGDCPAILNRMIASYLVHRGFSGTAEVFAKSTNQQLSEEMSSIRNRQKILKLVMAGRIGQAIELTTRVYPGVLENNSNLMFMLKCRQFIEMVNGCDFEQTESVTASPTEPMCPNQTSVIQSTKSYQNGNGTAQITNGAETDERSINYGDNQDVNNFSNSQSTNNRTNDHQNHGEVVQINNHLNSTNSISNVLPSNSSTGDYVNDVEMENGHIGNGNSFNKNGTTDTCNSLDVDEDMDVDVMPKKSRVATMLEFGRDLLRMHNNLEKANGGNGTNQQMLRDAFSLLAYSNPWSSPMGWQLSPTERERVCSELNSAILESMNFACRSSPEICYAHTCELLRLMASSSLGSCAFVAIDDIIKQH